MTRQEAYNELVRVCHVNNANEIYAVQFLNKYDYMHSSATKMIREFIKYIKDRA